MADTRVVSLQPDLHGGAQGNSTAHKGVLYNCGLQLCGKVTNKCDGQVSACFFGHKEHLGMK